MPRIDLPSADLTKPGTEFADFIFLNPIQFVRANLTDATLREAPAVTLDCRSTLFTQQSRPV